jgi:16S rRNA (adenine1518-N6/adenine1519-N6)-dimethyltransferase
MEHRAKKSLGQNFLMHAQTAARIVHASGVGKSDTVLEIGPGTGMLTKELLKIAGRVVAVEADGALISELSETFSEEVESGALELIHADIREFDPSAIKGVYALVANIPYYITGEIIRSFLTATHKPSSMTLLVQKEVAERIARSTKESLLSLSVKAYGTPKYCFTVPRGAFRPAPNVDSAVLYIGAIQSPFKNTVEEARFFEVLRAGFAHKRKYLRRNLEEVAAPEMITQAFARATLAEKARADDVSLAAWMTLAEAL